MFLRIWEGNLTERLCYDHYIVTSFSSSTGICFYIDFLLQLKDLRKQDGDRRYDYSHVILAL